MIKVIIFFLVFCYPALLLTDELSNKYDHSIAVVIDSDLDIDNVKDIHVSLNKSDIIPLKMHKNVMPAFVDNKIIFLSKDGSLCSVDEKNIEKYYWKLDITKGNDIYRASILYSEEVVLYATDDNIYGIDFNTGKIKWQKEIRSVIAGSPIVVNNNFIVVTIDNYLYAFNVSDGTLSWSSQESLPEVKSYNSLSLTSYNDVLVVSFSNGKIVALNSLNGLKMWENNISDANIAFSNGVSLHAIAGTVVVMDKLHSLSSIDIESGKIKWLKNLEILSISQIKEDIIAAVIDNKLSLLNINTGDFLWQYNLLQHGKSDTRWSTPTFISDDILIIGSDGCVVLIDSKSGTLKLVKYILSAAYHIPIFVNSAVYVITNKDKVVIFH